MRMSGERHKLYNRNGVYVLPVWVGKPNVSEDNGTQAATNTYATRSRQQQANIAEEDGGRGSGSLQASGVERNTFDATFEESTGSIA